MSTKIFVNLPVKDLQRSVDFFTGLGFQFSICDTTKSTEVLVCLTSESRQKADDLVRKAVAAGGSTYAEP